MNTDMPTHLYHYTSIQTLALILKNKNIKFNRLDRVDDLTEAETLEGTQLGQHYFISCWTDSDVENIPLWKMYTDFKGVRIRLPSNMFKSYELCGTEGDKHRIQKFGLFMDLRLPYRGPIRPDNLLTPDYLIMPAFSGSDFLAQVDYTDDISLLRPKVLFAEPSTITISLKDFCRHKSMEWSFQKEWRFILKMTPIDKQALKRKSSNITEILPTITREHLFPLQYYFLKVQDAAIDEIKVLIGPKCSDGDLAIIQVLMEKYAPKASIKRSAFTGKL